MRPALATAAVAYPPSQIGIGWAGVGVTRTSYRPSSGAQNGCPVQAVRKAPTSASSRAPRVAGSTPKARYSCSA